MIDISEISFSCEPSIYDGFTKVSGSYLGISDSTIIHTDCLLSLPDSQRLLNQENDSAKKLITHRINIHLQSILEKHCQH